MARDEMGACCQECGKADSLLVEMRRELRRARGLVKTRGATAERVVECYERAVTALEEADGIWTAWLASFKRPAPGAPTGAGGKP